MIFMESNYPTIKLQFNEHAFLCVRYALAQELKRVRQELVMIKEGANRDLVSWEKSMLPSTLQQASQQDLKENINPWITLEDYIGDTLKDMESAYMQYQHEEELWHNELVNARRKQREEE